MISRSPVWSPWEIPAGDVRHIDTASFRDTAKALGNHMETFAHIAYAVDGALGALLENWQGQGRDEFLREMRQICYCIGDIHQTMYVLKHTLDAAADAYGETDQAVAGAFRSSMERRGPQREGGHELVDR